MAGQIEPIARMAQQLSRLPGIGAKTAQRLAYHIVSLPEDQVHELASAIWQGRKAVKYCSICGNYTVEDPCPICADERRHNGVICVVRDPRDVAAMERGAAHLMGEHDFKSFCMAASAVGKPTCRNVEEISIASEEILGEPHRVVTVRGNAFLHSMVRTIVGTLVMVGRGQRDADWVAEVLAARDRQAAGENAPACGLIFWSVGY